MRKERVLVVEDENIVAMDIERGLKRLGYEVPAVVSSGEEAINCSEKFQPDLILMDIQIKGDLDGIETSRIVWQKFRIPVIFLTAYADEKTLERAKLTEPFGYILKPFEENELHTAIEVALKKHRSIQEREAVQLEALQVSEERYKHLVESIQDYAIFMLDPNGYVETWNKGAERIKGYSSSEIVGQHFSVFYTTEDKIRNHTEYEINVAKNVGRYQEEGWRIKKDGTMFWANINITALYDKKNILKGFAIITRDISQLRANETALKTTQDLLQSIIDFAPMVIFVKDTNGRFILANRSFSELVGAPLKNIIGKTDYDFFPADLVKVFHENDEKVLKKNEELKIEEVAIQNGVNHIFLSIKFPLVDAHGIPYAVCGISNDITENKKIEEQKHLLLQDLQIALKARDEFLSIASHELKTPLTSLKLQFQLQSRLINKGDPKVYEAERINQNYEKAEKLLSRLERLVDDMLDISRISTGRLNLQKVEANLSEVVKDCISRTEETFLAKTKEKINFSGDGETIAVFDPMRIEQVVNNLLQNSLKYGQGKSVSVQVFNRPNSVVVSVEDYGMGIPKEKQARIFDRFERAVSANEVSGLGLGLFISEQIISAHKGKIWVESEVDKGSKFSFELPKNCSID